MNNMSYEIIEAIEAYYKNDEDMIADCMLCLLHGTDRDGVWQWFIDHNRCVRCGSKLKQRTYKEPHNEIDNGVYETLYEWYCPKCGKDVD